MALFTNKVTLFAKFINPFVEKIFLISFHETKSYLFEMDLCTSYQYLLQKGARTGPDTFFANIVES